MYSPCERLQDEVVLRVVLEHLAVFRDRVSPVSVLARELAERLVRRKETRLAREILLLQRSRSWILPGHPPADREPVSGVDVIRVHGQRDLRATAALFLLAAKQQERGARRFAVAERRVVRQPAFDVLLGAVDRRPVVRVAGEFHDERREAEFGARFAECRVQAQGALHQFPCAQDVVEPGAGKELGFLEVSVGLGIRRRPPVAPRSRSRRFRRAAPRQHHEESRDQ